MIMLTDHLVNLLSGDGLFGEGSITQIPLPLERGRGEVTWHFRRDWLFTPFVVVVGGKYFLPAPECLLFDQVKFGSLSIFCCS